MIEILGWVYKKHLTHSINNNIPIDIKIQFLSVLKPFYNLKYKYIVTLLIAVG